MQEDLLDLLDVTKEFFVVVHWHFPLTLINFA
jgi:hypothetical protein